MEKWSVEHDAPPYVRSEARSSYTGLVIAVAVALIVGLAVAYYWYVSQNLSPLALPDTASAPPASPPAAEAPATVPATSPAPAIQQTEPEIRHPVPAPSKATAKALPSLDMSDTMMRRALGELMGRNAFASLVIPKDLVRRIVATIDNLPGPIASQRLIPLNPVPGRFAVRQGSEEAVLDEANFARYAGYVRAFEAVDANALVKAYVHAYPLFQRAYEELGYPNRHFNDRLIETIDDMLDAPQVAGPIPLLQPKVLYEFADPDLETRSAGQKLLVRMGPENAARVKAKLREIRQALLAAAERPQ